MPSDRPRESCCSPEESRLIGSAMEAGLPSAVGVALGFRPPGNARRRGAATIAEVIAFPIHRA